MAEFLRQHCEGMGLTVAAIATTVAEGLAACRAQLPDLLLIDFSLPDGDGIDAARTLFAEMPELRLLGISSHCDPWTMYQVQKSGMHGFVDKNSPGPEELTDAIRHLLAGRAYFSPALVKAAGKLRVDPGSFTRVLSDYEIQILSLIGTTMSDEEIASYLGIKPATMQSRRRDIMRKLDIHTTPKLIQFAIVNGLTRPEQLDQYQP